MIKDVEWGGQRPTRSIQASTRTIMFTDIVASTQHLAALGDKAWTELLERHDEISVDVLEQFGGRCVKSTGDGLLAELPGSGAPRYSWLSYMALE